MAKPPGKCLSLFSVQVCLVILFVATNLHYHSNLAHHAAPSPVALQLPGSISSSSYPLGTNHTSQAGYESPLKIPPTDTPAAPEHEATPGAVTSPTAVHLLKTAEPTVIVEALSDGLASQYAEVDWVMGIQARRKEGLEPAPIDPYADIPEEHLQPSYRANGAVPPPAGLSLRLPPSNHMAAVGTLGGAFTNDPILSSYVWPWARQLSSQKSKRGAQLYEMHFVHVPKCGGTSITRVLRRMACTMHNGTADSMDCCKSPGFCGAPEKRLCSVIRGCINHNPNIHSFFQPSIRPSFTILRSSLSRVVSSWHYRCHNPNFDCYKLRPEFRTWKAHLALINGKPQLSAGFSNRSFDEFLSMPEYHNIATRMFSSDVPPYGGKPRGKESASAVPVSVGVTLGPSEFASAMERLRGFAWVGLMEHMGTSLLLMAAKLGVPLERSDFIRMRASHTPAYNAFAKTLKPSDNTQSTSANRIAKVLAANAYDEELWHASRQRQCSDLRALGLLAHPVVLKDSGDAPSETACNALLERGH